MVDVSLVKLWLKQSKNSVDAAKQYVSESRNKEETVKWTAWASAFAHRCITLKRLLSKLEAMLEASPSVMVSKSS